MQPDKEELKDFKEKLKNKNFFLSIDDITAASYTKISKTLLEMGYYQDAIKNFSSSADYFLIALAYQESYIIVTHEAKSGSNAKRQIKIPNVCEKLNIECIDVAEFLRRCSIKFALNSDIAL